MRGKIISYCCPGLQFICVSLHDSGCVTGMYGHVCVLPAYRRITSLSFSRCLSVLLTTVIITMLALLWIRCPSM